MPTDVVVLTVGMIVKLRDTTRRATSKVCKKEQLRRKRGLQFRLDWISNTIYRICKRTKEGFIEQSIRTRKDTSVVEIGELNLM